MKGTFPPGAKLLLFIANIVVTEERVLSGVPVAPLLTGFFAPLVGFARFSDCTHTLGCV